MATLSKQAPLEATGPCKDQQAQPPGDFESIDAEILSDAEAQSLIDVPEDRHGWYRNLRLVKYSLNRLFTKQNPNSCGQRCSLLICNISGEMMEWDGTFDMVNGEIHFRNSLRAFFAKHVLPFDAMTQYLFPRLQEWGLLTVRRKLGRKIHSYSEKRLDLSTNFEQDMRSLAAWLFQEEPDLEKFMLLWCAFDLVSMRYSGANRRAVQLLIDARAMIKLQVDRAIEERNKLPGRDEEARFNEWRARRAVEVYAKPTSVGSFDCIIDVQGIPIDILDLIHQITLRGALSRKLLCDTEERMRPGINTPWKQMCWIYIDYDMFKKHHEYAIRRLKRNALPQDDATSKATSAGSSLSAVASTIEDQTLQTSRSSVLLPARNETRIRVWEPKKNEKKKEKTKRSKKKKGAKEAPVVTYEEKLHIDDETDDSEESIAIANCNVPVNNTYDVLQPQLSTSSTINTTNQADVSLNSKNVASSACPPGSEGWQVVQNQKAQCSKKHEAIQDTSKAKRHEIIQSPFKALPQCQAPKRNVVEYTSRSLSPTPLAPWERLSSSSINSWCDDMVINALASPLEASSRSKDLQDRSGLSVSLVKPENTKAESIAPIVENKSAPSPTIEDFLSISQGSLSGHIMKMGQENVNNTTTAALCSAIAGATQSVTQSRLPGPVARPEELHFLTGSGLHEVKESSALSPSNTQRNQPPAHETLPPGESGSPLELPLMLIPSGSPRGSIYSVCADSAVDLTNTCDPDQLRNVGVHVKEYAHTDCVADFDPSSRAAEAATAVDVVVDNWESTDSTINDEDVDAQDTHADDGNMNNVNDFRPVQQHPGMSHVMTWLTNKYTLAHAGLGETEAQVSRWQSPTQPPKKANKWSKARGHRIRSRLLDQVERISIDIVFKR